MNIEYYRKNIYGRELTYIRDKKIKSLISGLTNKETIDKRDIKILEELGFRLIEVLQPNERAERERENN